MVKEVVIPKQNHRKESKQDEVALLHRQGSFRKSKSLLKKKKKEGTYKDC